MTWQINGLSIHLIFHKNGQRIWAENGAFATICIDSTWKFDWVRPAREAHFLMFLAYFCLKCKNHFLKNAKINLKYYGNLHFGSELNALFVKHSLFLDFRIGTTLPMSRKGLLMMQKSWTHLKQNAAKIFKTGKYMYLNYCQVIKQNPLWIICSQQFDCMCKMCFTNSRTTFRQVRRV